MAGDWIKMRVDLPDDPAVIGIVDATGIDTDAVIGKLFRLWSWADAQTTDGRAKVSEAWVDRYTGVPGFAKAMAAWDWLVVCPDGVIFPKFDKHNGKSAKVRAENTERQRLSRTSRDKVVTNQPQKRDASSLLSASLLSSESKTTDGAQPTAPTSFDRFWKAYPRKVGKHEARKAWDKAGAAKDIDRVLRMIRLLKESPDWFEKEIQFIPHPSTWINQRRWEDDDPPRAEILGPRKSPQEIAELVDFLQKGATNAPQA